MSGDPARPPLHFDEEGRTRIREEIDRAGGREVCFIAGVDTSGLISGIRAVARGNRAAVLAAARDAPPGGVVLHNHPSGGLEPSDADLAVAAQLYERGLGSAIVTPDASGLYVVVEPPVPEVVTPLDPEALEELIGPGGELATAFDGFEDRPAQREMLRLIAGAYNEGGTLLVEAGTGTGKSLAYLLPAASWAMANGKRTVVSTNTINLQEQLVSKDLPLARSILGGDLRWALAKGRGNYMSIRRAELALGGAASLFPDDRGEELKAVREWMETTEDGSLATLGFEPSPEVWEEVRSDSDACLRARCPHFQRCFYQKARRGAASADILVVNHHLLFADLSVRQAAGNYRDSAVLPPYDRLVLDEAHHVESTATDHLGVQTSAVGLRRLFSRMDRKGKGVLSSLASLLSGEEAEDEDRALADRIEERVRPRVEVARSASEALVDGLIEWMGKGESAPKRLGGLEGEEPLASGPRMEAFDTLLTAMGDLRGELAELVSRLQLREDPPLEVEGRLLDLQGLLRRVESARGALVTVLSPGPNERDAYVRWLAVTRSERRSRNLVMSASPVDVGEGLEDALWDRVETVVLTSATLATADGFGFVRDRIGLNASTRADVVESILPSPFDFPTQSLLCVPTDLPSARGGTEAFQEATVARIVALAEASGGGVFALFTSYRALRSVAEGLRASRFERQFPLFVQGQGPRSRLLGEFTKSGNGVLLGTSSFWEGVDVPGPALRALLIQKLPFLPPNEPVTAARLEALQTAGLDPFWAYLVPHAALRLKQGFGRLIRARGDRGAVVLLDDRILTQRYGKTLLDALPPATRVTGPSVEIDRRIREFYAGTNTLSGTGVGLD